MDTLVRDISVATDATHITADVTTATLIRNSVYAASAGGSTDEDVTPAEFLQEHTGTSQIHRMWLIELGECPVALAELHLPLDPGSTTAHAEILVLPAFAGHGLGSRALAVAEAAARSAGRQTVAGWAEHPADPSVPELAAPTGFGTIPRDHIARFALRHGYVLEQVDRKSTFDLTASFAGIEDRLRDAEVHSRDYEAVVWTGHTPPCYLEDMAHLRSRMSTDAPSAGLDASEEAWDAARVMQNDARRTASGAVYQVTAARHLASGRLVAYNVLYRSPAPQSATIQGDTLVLREHRGHRLGMLVKTRGLIAWRAANPLSPRVLTWNAEENRPMLSINETLGFVPAGYIGAWQKVL